MLLSIPAAISRARCPLRRGHQGPDWRLISRPELLGELRLGPDTVPLSLNRCLLGIEEERGEADLAGL